MTETAGKPLTRYATRQEIPPAHRGGYTRGRGELVVEGLDYDQAVAAARRRVPEDASGAEVVGGDGLPARPRGRLPEGGAGG